MDGLRLAFGEGSELSHEAGPAGGRSMRERCLDALRKCRVLTVRDAWLLTGGVSEVTFRRRLYEWRDAGWVTLRDDPRDRRRTLVLPGRRMGLRALRSRELRGPLWAASLYVEMVRAGLPPEAVAWAEEDSGAARLRRHKGRRTSLYWVVRAHPDASAWVWVPASSGGDARAVEAIRGFGAPLGVSHVLSPALPRQRERLLEEARKGALPRRLALPPEGGAGAVVRWLSVPEAVRRAWCLAVWRRHSPRTRLRSADVAAPPGWYLLEEEPRRTWLVDGRAFWAETVARLGRSTPDRDVVVVDTVATARTWLKALRSGRPLHEVLFLAADAPPGEALFRVDGRRLVPA